MLAKLLQQSCVRPPCPAGTSSWWRRPTAWSVSPSRARSTLSSPLTSSRLGPEPSALGCDDYDAERRTFKLEAPHYFNFAADVIDRWALAEQVPSAASYFTLICYRFCPLANGVENFDRGKVWRSRSMAPKSVPFRGGI